ncbi:MAG: hypothetical protein IJL45_04655 [Prevotella sp.]|nr:hypothetical protein [Prevotella sp.]
MKRVLFSLLAMFAVGSLWAQGEVTETDLSGYNDVVYAKSITVMKGSSEVNLPIWSKTHSGFVGVSFYLEVPEGATIKYPGSLSDDSYDKTQIIDLASWTGNQKEDGYMVIGALASTDKVSGDQLGFKENEHELGTIVIDVSSLDAGTYPVKVKNVEISKFLDGAANVVISEVVSTLTIIDRITLKETSEVAPEPMTGVDVRVERTIKADEWSTICLPFAMDNTQVKTAFGDDVKMAEFTGCEVDDAVTNIVVNFASIETPAIEANHPYLIKVTEAVSEFEVDNVNIEPEEEPTVVCNETVVTIPGIGKVTLSNKFIGTYVANTTLGSADVPVLYLTGNNFRYSVGNVKMKAFRGYFNLKDLSAYLANESESGAKIGFNVDDEVTAIEGINTNQRIVEGVYDLQGRKVMVKDGDINNLQRGLYIINGKKVAIK